MRWLLIITVIAIWNFARGWSSKDLSCASCGFECEAACGTRHFRACCFNFQRRKRAMPFYRGDFEEEARSLVNAIEGDASFRESDERPTFNQKSKYQVLPNGDVNEAEVAGVRLGTPVQVGRNDSSRKRKGMDEVASLLTKLQREMQL